MIIKEFGKFKKVYEGWYSEEEEAVALDSIAAEAGAEEENKSEGENGDDSEQEESNYLQDAKDALSELKEKLAENEEALALVSKVEDALAKCETEKNGEADETAESTDDETASEETSDDSPSEDSEKKETEEEELEESDFGKSLEYGNNEDEEVIE